MKFKKVFRRLTWGITPTKWLSLGYLKQQTASLKDLSQGVFQPTSTPKYQCKTFEEAMQRAGISEPQLEHQKRQNVIACRIFSAISAVIWLYAIFLIPRHPLEGLMVLLLGAFAAIYAWREHYNYTKLKYRQLYLTPKQWWGYFRQQDNV